MLWYKRIFTQFLPNRCGGKNEHTHKPNKKQGYPKYPFLKSPLGFLGIDIGNFYLIVFG